MPRVLNSILLCLAGLSGAVVISSADAADTPPLERIRISSDGTHFVIGKDDERFVIWGVNYDHDGDGRLIEDYWLTEWATVEEDFREIRDLRANVVRIHLQLGRFLKSPTEPDRQHLNQLKKLVALAEKERLYLDVTGLGCYHKQDVSEWYDALDEQKRWEVQARFWKEVATVCRNSPAIFCYDLMNEPVIGGNAEQGWLAGELDGKHFVQRLTLTPGDRSREEIAAAWVKTLTTAIREVDPDHLITVGVIPWALTFKGAKPLFYSEQVGEPLDFVSVHFYPQAGEVEDALTALRVYEVGKPLVIEEIFPLRASLEEIDEFIERSSTHADGWISFYWGRTAEENAAQGTLTGALVAAWLNYFKENSRAQPGAGSQGQTE